MMMNIADIRKDYMLRSLSENDIEKHPLRQFDKWWQEAIDSRIDEVNAMTLATANNQGVPSARIVLLKGYDESGFVFFTNYNSHKASDVKDNPNACLVFFWKELERQVRITGDIEKISDKESDEYFHSRPITSRIGAWASDQSSVIDSRERLEEKFKTLEAAYSNKEIPRPPHWGGYRVIPRQIEFWQGRPGRLHDRIEYNLVEWNRWSIKRLAP
ncbi:MAG: pyridoxamine 5'-phosphate oxidase [Ferruginibacter sp.]|nr:pyridoxamine 5'-phosphate oxidase [Ferruginibacter sp.]